MLWDNSISKDVAHDIMQCSPEAPTVTEHDDSKDLKKTEQLPAAPSVQSKKDDGPRYLTGESGMKRKGGRVGAWGPPIETSALCAPILHWRERKKYAVERWLHPRPIFARGSFTRAHYTRTSPLITGLKCSTAMTDAIQRKMGPGNAVDIGSVEAPVKHRAGGRGGGGGGGGSNVPHGA